MYACKRGGRVACVKTSISCKAMCSASGLLRSRASEAGYRYKCIQKVTPPHELPTFVLYRKYRVKTAFPAGPDSVSLKNYRKQTQISRERVSQLIHVRREVRILYLSSSTEIILTFQQDLSVNSFRFDAPNPKPTFPRKNQKNQKNHLLGNSKRLFFLVFPRKKMVLGRKTNFFLGKRWFWAEKPTFS